MTRGEERSTPAFKLLAQEMILSLRITLHPPELVAWPHLKAKEAGIIMFSWTTTFYQQQYTVQDRSLDVGGQTVSAADNNQLSTFSEKARHGIQNVSGRISL